VWSDSVEEFSSAAGFLPHFYFQQVKGERSFGALQRRKFSNSLMS
jgi:hypothetical protein